MATATAGDDVFVQASTGDQYFVGGAGIDTVYLNGNPSDYLIHAVSLTAAGDHPAISGYELRALNGSGNLFSDATTESVHFLNGLYVSQAGLASLR